MKPAIKQRATLGRRVSAFALALTLTLPAAAASLTDPGSTPAAKSQFAGGAAPAWDQSSLPDWALESARLAAIVNLDPGPQEYVESSSMTSGAFEHHDLPHWPCIEVPEPKQALLVACGLLFLFLLIKNSLKTC